LPGASTRPAVRLYHRHAEDQYNPAYVNLTNPIATGPRVQGVLFDEPQRIPDSGRRARSIAASVDWLATAHSADTLFTGEKGQVIPCTL
jgi:hypothetical protein